MKCGIYKLTIGENFYYGQSLDLLTRREQHRRLLMRGCHYNQWIQRAYNKHRRIKFEILCVCDRDELDTIEQTLIDKFIDHPNCMNLARDSKCPTKGQPRSDEVKKKISEANKAALKGITPWNKGMTGQRFTDAAHKAHRKRTKYNVKLSDKDLTFIYSALDNNTHTQVQLAEMFGTTQAAISYHKLNRRLSI